MTLAKMRRGFLLPLVLVVVVLMSLVLYYFHVVAMSEYSQVHKIAHNFQLDLIVDSALIEMAIQQEKQAACPGATPPPWVDEIIPEIDANRPKDPDDGRAPNGQGGPLALGGPREVDQGGSLPGTDEVTRGSGNDPAQLEIKTTVGPFHHVPAEYDAKSIYAEPVFEDRQKDVVAWHLRGPIKVEARLKPSGRAAGELVSTWNGTVAITDATPIASEFALFAYQPPTCEDENGSIDQSINDLQRGGRFTVHARKVGRVLVRGPFLILPEDAGTEKTYLTDRDRGAGDHAPSFSYVESKWKGWSAIPGPRALLPPPLSLGNSLIKDALDFLHGLWDKIPTIGEVEAQRPKREHSPVLRIDFKLPQLCVGVSPAKLCTPGQIGPWEFPPLSIVIGVASGGEPTATFGAWWSIIPDDEVGRFATGMYFHGLRKPGEQLFSIMGRTQDPPAGAGDETVQDLFRGVRFKASDDNPAYADFSDGISGLVTGDGEDNEVILPEPVPRTTGGARPDLGIIAHYGVAIFDAQTLFDIGVLDLLKEVLSFSLPGGPLLGTLVSKVLDFLGIKPDIYIVLRQWKVKGYDLTDDPENLTAEKVTEVFENALPDNIDADDLKPMGIVSPYGMYQYTHSVNSWNRIKESLANFATNALVNKAVSFAVGKLGQFIGWLFKNVGESRVGTAVDQIRALGGNYVRDNAVLSAVFRFCRGFSDKLFKLLLRVGVSPTTIKNLLKDQARDQAKGFLQGKIRDPNGFLPRPVKALLGVFGPEAVDHPFKARFDSAMDATKGMREAAKSYPYGFLPPKYSSWASLATRIYPDMKAYLDAEVVDGVLPLRGIVLLRELDYEGEPIKYRGAGIIVVVTKDESKGPVLNARVEPVESNDSTWLTLVHLVTADVFEKKEREPLKLGEVFTGTVYAETGVAPAKRGCLIFGNLVCGHINKRKIDKGLKGPNEGVTVRYADEVLPHMLKAGKKPLWTVEVLGTPLPPPPPTN
jgi:hypothetical protein